MYTLNHLADGSTELCVLKPFRVALFYDPALAATVAESLNDYESLREPILPGFEDAGEECPDEDEEVVLTFTIHAGTLEGGKATRDFGDDDGAWPIESESAPRDPVPLVKDRAAALAEVEGEGPHSEAAMPAQKVDGRKIDANKLLDAIVDSMKQDVAAEAAAEQAEAPKAEPTESDWEGAFVAIKGGAGMNDVAETLGVPMPQLRGKYGMWSRKQKKDDVPSPKDAPAATAPAENETRPFWWRQLVEMLGKLGYRDGWTAQRDLDLIEGLARGKQMAEVADDLGVEFGKAKARFIALTPDGVTIEKQAQLLQVLRARAGAA
ncbi:hypothetical protein C8J27_11093 [Rhodobacter aestuarii]|uniref:Uncharacterized protein n=1 Tax=Rhodobacter aestuarii TaxID=453582 RepID=A0A1N7Q1Z1_9RHOB|nr:hypothetical protein [Rhodobacter aestuarii]PTV94042.1 hypothetical protein C8J27_11093 [Rhodobacter aestuarii]SIT16913.1 hypothetical protein SAMN05421580_11293 [Rhodobacter aestuarii]